MNSRKLSIISNILREFNGAGTNVSDTCKPAIQLYFYDCLKWCGKISFEI